MTSVVLVHGVAFGPSTLGPLARRLGGATVLERRGYGTRSLLAPATRVEDHVADLVALLDGTGTRRAVVAGASGGATVALAAALAVPERIAVAVCHEPAVGSLAPALQQLVRAALAGGGAALARTLAGEVTWSRLSGAERDALHAHDELIAADAQAFLAWEPAFGGPAAPVVCTVGAESPALRHAIAATVAQRTGGELLTIPACGHLPQFDAPDAFASIVLDRMYGAGGVALDHGAVAAAEGPA